MTGPLPAYSEAFSYDTFERIASRTWSRDGLQYTIGLVDDPDPIPEP
jgi:hypothetical protein